MTAVGHGATPSAPSGPVASCVIVAFHRPERVRAALQVLGCAELEVVVVNVEADPRVRECCGAHTVIDVDANVGYAAAVNRGARAATADVVVYLNDDAVLSAAAARGLVDVVRSGAADVAVPRVVDERGGPEWTIAAVPSVGALAREWLLLPDRPIPSVGARVRVEKWRTPTAPERIGAASAVVVAVRTDLLLAEPLPEEYFLYWEESEWFWWLRERGAVVQYRPEIVCVHSGGRADVRPEKSRLMARNAVRCVRRTQGRAAAVAALGIVVVWNLRLVLADLVRMVARPTSTRRARLRARWCGLGAAATSWGELR